MKTICSKQIRRLEDAAELRAAGVSWKNVAKSLKIRLGFIRRWPERYPELWARLYATAIEQTRIDSELEAVVHLRDVMRGEDQGLRRAAAHDLLVAEKSRPRQLPNQYLLEGLDDELPDADPETTQTAAIPVPRAGEPDPLPAKSD